MVVWAGGREARRVSGKGRSNDAPRALRPQRRRADEARSRCVEEDGARCASKVRLPSARRPDARLNQAAVRSAEHKQLQLVDEFHELHGPFEAKGLREKRTRGRGRDVCVCVFRWVRGD